MKPEASGVPLSDDGRRKLYWALLRGLGKEAQDRMCAANQQHDWSPWHRSILKKDVPLRFDPSPIAIDETYRVKSERVCLNCGKEEVV
jgi:hypothetical protein